MSNSTSSPPILTALRQGPCPEFQELAARYLEEYVAKIEAGLRELPEERLWWRPNRRSNSVGNLLLHLVGNLSLWIGNGLADAGYQRDRAKEFSTQGGFSKDELLAGLTSTVADCHRILEGLDPAEIASVHQVQGHEIDGLGIAFHAVEHMSYHTGQILWMVKSLAGDESDLELYPQHRGE